MKSSSALALAVAATLTLSACAQAEPVEEVSDQVQEAEVEEAPVIPRHPLTGKELLGATVTGPSIAIKIDNTAAGRPQVGIAAADLVFEELVEGGVTRYLAVFHTAIPEEVGPVRSGRPQDAEIVASLGGVFVFSGVGNNNVREIISRSGLTLVEQDTSTKAGDGKFFFRSDRKGAPLNLHIEAAGLLENYATLAPPVEQYQYVSDLAESSAVVNGVPITKLSALFSSGVESVWEWDQASGTYLKFLLNGSPDNDANGEQISATNVLILSPNYIDIEGLPSAQLAGQSDKAFIATGGHILAGRFTSTSAKSPLVFTDLEDNPVFLAPGKTFVLLAPGEGSTAGGVDAGLLRYTSAGQEVVVNF
jgi:hypothetical protein